MSNYRPVRLSDFLFEFKGHGHYIVTYYSPKTSKAWSATTSDMPLIDATKNEEYPKQVHLVQLKRLCKSEGASW